MNLEKIYIELPFNIKEEGKDNGAKYDVNKKSWYVCNKKQKDLFELVEVNVPFKYKDIAKANGCLWNVEKKGWFTCQFNVVNIEQKIELEMLEN
jgi:hypothetical protein